MADDPPVRLRLPDRFDETARRFAASGAQPAVPRVAATVVLLRPGLETGTRSAAGFEAYAHRRAATMAFAPSMYAFPGGSVDIRDAEVRESSDVAGRDIDVAFAGPTQDWWAGRLGLAAAQARAVVCAAVREVFEECGVLLAGPDESTVVGDVSGVDWESVRIALQDHQVGLADLLASRGLVVRSDLLVPWARWVTPEFEPRRFDTYFFLARLPRLQRTRDVGGEAEHTVWAGPAELAQLPMLPPTAYTLRQLAGYDTIDAAMAAGQSRHLSTPVLPRFATDENGPHLLIP
jgi:8-oxo-dGTP pyrophosphatase MutT (NUDIX family)